MFTKIHLHFIFCRQYRFVEATLISHRKIGICGKVAFYIKRKPEKQKIASYVLHKHYYKFSFSRF